VLIWRSKINSKADNPATIVRHSNDVQRGTALLQVRVTLLVEICRIYNFLDARIVSAYARMFDIRDQSISVAT